jgi:hypothetical protein
MKRSLLVLLAVLSLMPLSSMAAVRGVVVVGPRYVPGWYGPRWGWGGPIYRPYFVGPVTGDVKLDTRVKDAQVFINGAYAGETGKLKTMHLRPGNYNIEIRSAGRTVFGERVYVVADKTVHLRPEF